MLYNRFMIKHITAGDGNEFAVFDHGTGVPLLLVHGFPLDHTMWRGQIEGLADRCRIIAPDLRGFGGSGVTSGTVTMDRFASDLVDIVNVLDVTEPVVYCGLSMGGYIGWRFAQQAVDRMRALIQCDTRAAADAPDAAENRLRVAESVMENGTAPLARAMLEKLFAAKTRAEQPDVVESVQQTIVQTDPAGVAAASRGMAERVDSTPDLKNITAPTLLICGAEDAITTAAEMESLTQHLPAARYVEIADAGHMAPLEQPQATNAAIRQFLDELDSERL